jgi:monomeric isocitrate dehydrogenase
MFITASGNIASNYATLSGTNRDFLLNRRERMFGLMKRSTHRAKIAEHEDTIRRLRQEVERALARENIAASIVFEKDMEMIYFLVEDARLSLQTVVEDYERMHELMPTISMRNSAECIATFQVYSDAMKDAAKLGVEEIDRDLANMKKDREAA